MLHSDLLRLSGFHFRFDVEEGFIDSSGLGTDFILSDEHLGGQIELITVLNINNQEDGSVGVFPENFVDLKIMGLERLAGGVPPDELLFLADLPHHVEHCLVVQVVQKPDAWLTGIFLEGNRVAIDDLYMLIMCIAEKGADDSFVPLFEVDSIEVIDNG